MNRLPNLNGDATTNGHVVTAPTSRAPLATEGASSCQEATPSPNGDNGKHSLAESQEAIPNPPATSCQDQTPSPNGDNGELSLAELRKAIPQPLGRDAKGRFARGNKGGPGNPFARQIARYRRAICNAVTEQDMHQLARTLLRQGLRGDVKAAELLLNYVIGKPTEAVDPDRLDRDEWRLAKESAVPPVEVEWLMSHFRAVDMCQFANLLWPVFVREMKKALADVARNPPVPDTPTELASSGNLIPLEELGVSAAKDGS